MRAPRTLLLAAGLIGAAPPPAPAFQAAPSPKTLLAFRPFQPAEYDTPADEAAVAACKVETELSADGKMVRAYTVRDGEGKVLRRFVDLDGKPDPKTKNPTLEQYSYYQDGFEVYREIDQNNDRRPDECRWLNAGGTRVLAIKYDGDRVALAWRRLSAEEATKVLVQGLVSGKLPLIESVLATPAELTALGLPKGLIDAAAAAVASCEVAANDLRGTKNQPGRLKGWGEQTAWGRFDGGLPHVIPADAAPGLRDDVILYENGLIWVASPGGDPMKTAYLQVPELVKVGDLWKFVALPAAVDPTKPTPPATVEGIRAAVYRETGSPGGGRPAELVALEKRLADYDAGLAAVNPADPKGVSKFHHGRLSLLYEIIKVAKAPDDLLLYNKQAIDDLATCYQTGLFAKGAELLDQMIERGGPIASYAAFRKVLAEYAMDDAAGNPVARQKEYMEKLARFLKDHAKSDEAPDALLQLAMNHEFNGEEEDAKRYYSRLAAEFPDSEAAKKAPGAVRRLDLDGKTLALKGAGLRGEAIDVAAFRGKPAVVLFWHSGYESVRRELPELAKVAAKHKGLAIVGVNLDGGDKAALESFLKGAQPAWPTIVEPEGMDGRLATEFGILTFPQMFVLDAQGKVVSRVPRTAVELDKLLERSVAARDDAPGVR